MSKLYEQEISHLDRIAELAQQAAYHLREMQQRGSASYLASRHGAWHRYHASAEWEQLEEECKALVMPAEIRSAENPDAKRVVIDEVVKVCA